MAVLSIVRNGDICVGEESIIKLLPKTEAKQHIKKDGTPKQISQNKKKGKSSEVFSFTIEDVIKMEEHFLKTRNWLPYLIFVLSCNMARRVGDTMSLTWENFYYPETGKMRTNLLDIVEDKTDKFANPRINSACRKAIELYIEKTGCDPSLENYTVPICMQLYGKNKGEVMTDNGYYRAIKRAAAKLGIEYNVGTHSARKTFGMISRMIHPTDYDSMLILQEIFNHSDEKTTRNYIGLTKKKIDDYYDDMGSFYDEYVSGKKVYQDSSDTIFVTIKANDLRDIVRAAYESGISNAGISDPGVHIEANNEIMAMIDQLKK